MASRKQDLLGRLIDTAIELENDDKASLMDSHGRMALLIPKEADLSDDTEEDAAYQALRDDLSPGEASDVVETMRPLSKEEETILDALPLEGLFKVDDAAQEDFLIARSRDGYRGLDSVLDDAVYGENIMNKNEEQMERLGLDSDSDLGWSIPGASSLKKLARKGVSSLDPRRQYKMLRKGVSKAASLAKKFVPGRDAGKARMVKNLHAKLTREHANWLGLRDQKAGLPLKPPAVYAQMAKMWSKQQIRKGGLPISTSMGSDMGGDMMGAWWNPLSWFAEKTSIIVNNTTGERSAVGPDGTLIGPDSAPLPIGPDGQPMYPADPSMDPYAQAEAYAEPYAQDPGMEAYADPYASYGDPSTGIAGDDSLGAFALEILGAAKKDAAPNADQLVQIAVVKLRSGRGISPGEVSVLANLAKNGHPRAKRVYAFLLKEGVVMSGQDESGAWLHKLNPAYWFKSSDERSFIDTEREKWIENAKLQKKLGKRQVVLEQAAKAKQAAEAVEAAKAQAAATEQQLKDIAASIKGELIRDLNMESSRVLDISVGDESGHEKPTSVTAVVVSALNKAGKTAQAKALYAKIAKGESLTASELSEAKKIARALQKVKVVHGDLVETDPALTMLHGAFVGACILGGLEAASARSGRCGKAADVLSKKLAAGQPLSSAERKATAALIVETDRLRNLAKSHVSGGAFVGLDNALGLRQAAFIGAAKTMTAAEKKMLSALVKLAKAGNPRAIQGLANLKKSGEIMGGDFVGSAISETFKAAMMPITLPAKHLYKGAKWIGKKTGIIKGKSSPEQVRLAQLRAASKRRAAALARARAADAQTEAELRAQQAIAEAADAEAEAADAEALAKEAAMRSKEIEANPDMAYTDESEGDSSSEFVGNWTAFVGAVAKPKKNIKDVKDPFDPGSPMMKKAMQEKAIIAKANEQSATGIKIRSGAALYKKAKKGDKQAKAAIQTMVAKAKKGDPQAIRDTRAVQAGRLAVIAKRKAQKREAIALARQARRAKVVAFQKKLEAKTANKLARVERKVTLNRLAKIERKSAAGDKKARAYVAKQVALAQKGDKKAASRVASMQFAKTYRKAAPTKRERRNLALAQRQVVLARKGNPKAVRRLHVINAAAKAGNPNAKRAVERYKLAAARENALATGAIFMPSKKSKNKASKAERIAAVKRAKSKLAAGTASREELAAGARAAQALGDKETAGKLAVNAVNAPSATEALKKTAPVVAAKEAGNPEAKAAIVNNLEAAKKGDPDAIKKTGNVVAVQTLDDINKGRPVSQTMQDAINLNERIAAKDPAAIATAREINEAATSESPIPEATAAAVALSAAAVTAKALASKPKAKAEYLAKVNPALSAAEQSEAEGRLAGLVAKANEGTITPEEGVVGVQIAQRLNKPKLAAEIAAKAPPLVNENPLSSLPDMPLPPITGVLDLVKETLRAVTFSTRDPLANYRGGLASRAKAQSASEPVSAAGWSPFAVFKSFARNAPIIAPATGILASAASLAMALDAKKRKPTPAPAPAPAPVAAPAPAATVAAPAAPAAPATPSAAPEVAPAAVQTVEGANLAEIDGDDQNTWNEFRDLLAQALKTKKMSYSNYNKAMDLIHKDKPSQEERVAEGKKMLAYLSKRGVQVDIKEKVVEGDDGEGVLPPSAESVKARIRREVDEDGILPPDYSKWNKKSKKKLPVSSLGKDKTFADYVKEAIKAKKMSKSDFNKAIEIHLGKGATPEKKLASGEKILKFLSGKGVKVEA